MFTLGMKVPRLLVADAYTVGSGTHVSADAKRFSAYHIIGRKRPEWMDTQFGSFKIESRNIFFGLGFILHDLFSTPVTHEEIDESLRFLKTFHAGGTEFRIDEQLWRRVVDECNGIPPVKVEALRDGAVWFTGEPIVQVSAADGYGELAAYFESKLLQVFSTSEMATLMRHWLDYNKNLVKECTPGYISEDQLNILAALQTHDFGDRAGTCPQESERLGVAFLTSHFGTDTTSAAYLAWKLNGEKPVGSSIKALAHRIVQGFKEEGDSYKHLYQDGKGTFTSHVGDCYNFYRAVDVYLVALAKMAKESSGVIVARPDSGDPLEQLLYVYEAAKDAGLYDVVHKDRGLVGMTNLRGIQGDGMEFKTIMEINQGLLAKNFSPVHSGIYGIGGFLRNTIGRDNFGMTMKLCAVGEDKRPVMKFSHTPGKGSVPGLVKIVREAGQPTVRSLDEPGENELVMWFDGTLGKTYSYNVPFDEVRQRVLKEFHKFPLPRETFSPKIKELKKKLRHEYVS